MRAFIPMLQNNGNLAHFFGYSVEDGWLEYLDSSIFDKIYVADDLAFCETVKAKYSTEKDLVIEEPELCEVYRKLISVHETKNFIDIVYERISNGGYC